MPIPKVGDLIPGTNQFYEEADIANIKGLEETIAKGEAINVPPDKVEEPPAEPTITEGEKTALEKIAEKETEFLTSEETDMDKFFEERKKSIEAQQADTSGVGSEFSRKIAKEEAAFELSREETLAGLRGVGPATYNAVVSRLEKDHKLIVNDLMSRKEEALANFNTKLAERYDNLLIKQFEFKFNAQKEAFDRIMDVTREKRAERTEERLESAEDRQQAEFEREQKSDVRDLMKKYNASLSAEGDDIITEKDTLESAIAKAEDIISTEDKLDLEEKRLKNQETRTRIDEARRKASVTVGGIRLNSKNTLSVINGIQDLKTMAPTEQAEVTSDLNNLGFGSSKSPSWFKDYLEKKEGAVRYEGYADKKWNEIREDIVFGKKFLDLPFFVSLYGEDKASKLWPQYEQRVNAYRSAGFDDKEIAKMLGLTDKK